MIAKSVDVWDVASYILKSQGGMSTMKLHRLIYYAQAWSLVWDDQPLFLERIESWANGPICAELYDAHRGMFTIEQDDIPGDASKIAGEAKESVDATLQYYGPRSSQWLSELTHAEPPWKEAREGLEAGERGAAEISHASMAEYYGSLV